MLSPVIICCGVIRSGSTWSFNVCRLLAEMHARRRGEACNSCYLDEERIEDLLRAKVYIGSGPMVIKSHATGPLALQWIRTGNAKAVCTFRDPRDCVASDVEFSEKGFEASAQRVNESFALLSPRCRDFGRTLFVRYEEMMRDRLREIRRIAMHLDIPADDREVQWIDEQTNIHASRKVCQTIGGLSAEQAPVIVGTHRRHVTTLLHDNHIGGGGIGRWKHDLTPQQQTWLTRQFLNCLRDLGYET